MAPGLTARFAWEHAGTRTAKAQLPKGADVDCPEIAKKEAVAILVADPADPNRLDADDPCEDPGAGVDAPGPVADQYETDGTPFEFGGPEDGPVSRDPGVGDCFLAYNSLWCTVCWCIAERG